MPLGRAADGRRLGRPVDPLLCNRVVHRHGPRQSKGGPDSRSALPHRHRSRSSYPERYSEPNRPAHRSSPSRPGRMAPPTPGSRPGRPGLNRCAPVASNASHHLLECGSAVLLAKRIPRPADRHRLVLEEVPTADDLPALGGVQLEEEERARLKGHGPAASTWLPEVDLYSVPPGGKKPEPFVISDPHPEPHGHRRVTDDRTGGQRPTTFGAGCVPLAVVPMGTETKRSSASLSGTEQVCAQP